ncbi:site-specific DNA-methyltransferase [Acinetobacter baumannii]|nr:site-specific DNA-methyltransferase [Acinetobacter baumannii]MDC5234401.1 site-specific DNA-methyltransferase [Acinetobacter baumannii]
MLHDTVLLGDCLNLLKDIPENSVDLIYLDPPFFTGKTFKGVSRESLKEYSFDDIWDSSSEYAKFLFDRLVKCKFILKDTGSIFVHCDRNSTHIIRKVLDIIFSEENFQSEIIWSYKRWSNAKKGLLNQHQNIFFYSKSNDFKWNQQFVDYSATTNLDQILQKRERNDLGQSVYATDHNGEVVYGGAKKGVPLGDVWEIPFLNPKAKERTGYPTQKPLILLEKIIELTTNKGDVVLDPFCGSGTTLVAAKLLERKYIGMDISEDAIQLTKSRLNQPIKTESHLLKKGVAAYKNEDPWITEHLASFNYSRIPRNKGLDAILKDEIDNKTVFLRVQHKHESLDEAYLLMKNSLKNKPSSIGVLIQTKANSGQMIQDDVVRVIRSLKIQLDERIDKTRF